MQPLLAIQKIRRRSPVRASFFARPQGVARSALRGVPPLPPFLQRPPRMRWPFTPRKSEELPTGPRVIDGVFCFLGPAGGAL